VPWAFTKNHRLTFGLSSNFLQTPTTQALSLILVILLYNLGLLIFITLAGVVVSVMIDNKFYRNFFGVVVILLFASLLVAKSLFD